MGAVAPVRDRDSLPAKLRQRLCVGQSHPCVTVTTSPRILVVEVHCLLQPTVFIRELGGGSDGACTASCAAQARFVSPRSPQPGPAEAGTPNLGRRVRDREGLESRLQPAVVGMQRPRPKNGISRTMDRAILPKTERSLLFSLCSFHLYGLQHLLQDIAASLW